MGGFDFAQPDNDFAQPDIEFAQPDNYCSQKGTDFDTNNGLCFIATCVSPSGFEDNK